MLILVCDHPHCSAEATDEVAYPGVRWRLCADHADAERAFALQLRLPPTGPGCRIPGCDRPVHARHLCGRHYHRARRRGLHIPTERILLRRTEAATALRLLPGVPPTFNLSPAPLPPWVLRIVDRHRVESWARLRQELHRIAEVPL